MTSNIQPIKANKTTSVEQRILDALAEGVEFDDVCEVAKVTYSQLCSALQKESFHENLRIRNTATEMWNRNLIANRASEVMKNLIVSAVERNDVKAANVFLNHHEKQKRNTRQTTPHDFFQIEALPTLNLFNPYLQGGQRD
jgi:hypothetical protein